MKAGLVLRLFSLGLPLCAADHDVNARTLSGRPDMVSGGSVLLELTATAQTKIRVQVNGRDIGDPFHPGTSRGVLIGRVEGLKDGANRIEIHAGSRRAHLDLVNHPIYGPVFSGRPQSPFICQTEVAGLGPADDHCSAKTAVSYVYRSTAPIPKAEPGRPGRGGLPPGFKTYDPSAPPRDIAQTRTTDGNSVKFIVRREMGTINRSVYQIAFLHEPGTPLPDPWTRTDGWNGRLLYSFGGGCGAGYRQGMLLSTFDAGSVAAGFAVATASLKVQKPEPWLTY